MGSYPRFGVMILTSTVVMFALTCLTTQLDHVFWSETRAYTALIMGAAISAVMLGFMLGACRHRATNVAILGVGAVLFAVGLWLLRSQAMVTDVDYMKAMIPHHSIAIMTGERARVTDPGSEPWPTASSIASVGKSTR